MALTLKQARFVQEYLVDGNATAAAKRAGYSPKTADSIGSENMAKPAIAGAIAAAEQERAERVRVTADMVLKQYMRLAFFDIRKLYREDGSLKAVHELDDDTAVALAGVETAERVSGGEKGAVVRKVKLAYRRAALADIGKHLGMFKERHEHTGAESGPIQLEGEASPAVREILKRLQSGP